MVKVRTSRRLIALCMTVATAAALVGTVVTAECTGLSSCKVGCADFNTYGRAFLDGLCFYYVRTSGSAYLDMKCNEITCIDDKTTGADSFILRKKAFGVFYECCPAITTIRGTCESYNGEFSGTEQKKWGKAECEPDPA